MPDDGCLLAQDFGERVRRIVIAIAPREDDDAELHRITLL
jgi:hypothetical protein